MVRLTADLVTNAPQFFNPLHERELDLRSECLTCLKAHCGVSHSRCVCVCGCVCVCVCLCATKRVAARRLAHRTASRARVAHCALAFSTWLAAFAAAATVVSSVQLDVCTNSLCCDLCVLCAAAGNRIALLENLGATEVRACALHKSSRSVSRARQ